MKLADTFNRVSAWLMYVAVPLFVFLVLKVVAEFLGVFF